MDISHAPMDKLTLDSLIRAAEVSDVVPMFRVNNDPNQIQAVLEAGGMGLVVPDVDSIESAKDIVNAVRFQPLGERGMFGFARSAGYGYKGGQKYTKWSNEEVLLGIQIESKKAVVNIDQIISGAGEGIDTILSGRGDLANSLNLPGQKNHPSVLELEEKVFAVAKSYGKSVSVNLDPNSPSFSEEVAYWKAKGVQMITAGHDINVIKKNLENIVCTALEKLSLSNTKKER